MAGYVYIKSEPHLWTVGFYDPEGIWHPDSDKPSKDEAANRVRFLNGGFVTKGDEDIQDRKTNKDVITVKVELKNDDVNYFQEADVSPPQILEASGKTAAMLALMERMGMLPDNMSDEAIKSLGLKEAKLDAQPDITILIDGKAVKLDLLQFSGVTAVVSKCLDEIDEKINRIRRFSGRN